MAGKSAPRRSSATRSTANRPKTQNSSADSAQRNGSTASVINAVIDSAALPGNNDPMYSVAQLQPLLDALQAAKNGDFSMRLPAMRDGVLAQIYQTFNDVISLNENMA